MPSELRKVCRVFSVLCPYEILKYKTTQFNQFFSSGPSVAAFVQKWGNISKFQNKFVLKEQFTTFISSMVKFYSATPE